MPLHQRFPAVLLLLVAASFLSGCATTRPTYQPPTGPALATVKGGSANIIKFFSDGDSHVSIVEIDGLYLPPSFWTGAIKSVAIAPGTRKITLTLQGNNYAQAQDTITLEAAAGHTYQIEAQKVGIAFDVSVYDEGKTGAEVKKEDRQKVFSVRIQGGSAGRAAYVPIFIPVAR